MLQHPLYSPDLVPCDFFITHGKKKYALSAIIKHCRRGRRGISVVILRPYKNLPARHGFAECTPECISALGGGYFAKL